MSVAEKPRLCFFTTPGEITHSPRGFVNPNDFESNLAKIANVDVVDFTNTNQDLARLIMSVAQSIKGLMDQYDGFVVTGSKANLQFIAPRLAFAFGPGLNKTIAVTGSNIPANIDYSDARPSLVKAALVANTPFREVAILFNDAIVRGTRFQVQPIKPNSPLLKYESYDGPFQSMGEVTAHGVEINQRRKDTILGDTYHNDFETDVITVPAGPGLEPDFYRWVVNHKGVMIDSVDWNLVTRQPYSYIDLILDLATRNIPVMLTSRVNDTSVPEDEQLPIERLLEAMGGVAARYMNQQTAMAKFCWTIGRVENEIRDGKTPENEKLDRVRELMKRPYVGEYGINKPFTSVAN